MPGQDLHDSIGRLVRSSQIVDAGPAARLAAALGQSANFADAADLPPLRHWLYFLPQHPPAALRADGTVRDDGFLPVIDLPRRMWAGSRLHWVRPLRVGERVTKESLLTDVVTKQGRSGELQFLKVRHTFLATDGAVLLSDEQDVVYRGPIAADTPGRTQPVAPAPPPDPEWRQVAVPDEVLLFRYSALTFNAHRIHYDKAYATSVEGYTGLLVHGPLIATLMLDHLRQRLPGAVVRAFEFRAVSPAVYPCRLTLCAAPGEVDKSFRVWARDDAQLCMEGRAEVD